MKTKNDLYKRTCVVYVEFLSCMSVYVNVIIKCGVKAKIITEHFPSHRFLLNCGYTQRNDNQNTLGSLV